MVKKGVSLRCKKCDSKELSRGQDKLVLPPAVWLPLLFFGSIALKILTDFGNINTQSQYLRTAKSNPCTQNNINQQRYSIIQQFNKKFKKELNSFLYLMFYTKFMQQINPWVYSRPLNNSYQLYKIHCLEGAWQSRGVWVSHLHVLLKMLVIICLVSN